jgi:protein-S-isoprenylcysteine O-methyltransferase Ste14
MGQRVFVAARSLIYVCGFMAIWLWLIPGWIGLQTSLKCASASPLRWLGLMPLSLGAAIAVSCFVHFVARGRGTPAPFDAPRRLVVSGPYRYVRNPMYVGSGLFLAGCAILFSEFSIVLLWYALTIAIGVNLFILLYEEPTLRRKFDGDYHEYCRNVHRWIPRLRPWQPESSRSLAAGA